MKLLEKIQGLIGFTPAERKAVLMLVAAFLAGLGVRMFRTPPQAFDYGSSDSTFAARSAAPRADSLAAGGGSNRSGNPVHKDRKLTARDGPVDINRATKSQLVSLPGIGEAMAERILRYRDAHGPFADLSQLRLVKGIGEKTLERLSPFCIIRK